MTELWLKFKNEKGEDQRILVEGDKFIVGRHSECDLSIPNGKLSRQHIKIESFAEVFVVSDCGSSNGTTLNGDDLTDPVALKDGDKLNLGGGLEIETEIISDRPKAGKPNAADAAGDDSEDAGSESVSAVSSGGGSSVSASSNDSSIPTGVFIAAPVLVIVFLLCGGGFLLFFSGNGDDSNNRRKDDISSYSPTPTDTPEKSLTPKPSETVVGNNTPAPASPEPTNSPQNSDELTKIRTNSASFLQRIALKDPSANLKNSEIELVNPKLSQFKGSSALAENLKAVKNNSSQFQSLAQSKGLKPQFLAVAALAEIGSNRGNPLEVAQKMLPIFAELRVSLDNNLADDNLMMIAAYDQGKAGKFGALRNTLEALAKKTSVNPREIRTIWYLKKQGKITDAEFDFALRFIAIGTITQNPKDFNVNAEAVIFD